MNLIFNACIALNNLMGASKIKNQKEIAYLSRRKNKANNSGFYSKCLPFRNQPLTTFRFNNSNSDLVKEVNDVA